MAKLEYIDLEQTVLGLLIRNGSLINSVKLQTDDFSQQSHQIIFDAINQVSSKGLAVDIITVGESIEKEFRTVDMEYITNLATKSGGSQANLQHYASNIKRAARLRKARDIAHGIKVQIEEDQNCETLIERSIQQLMAIDADLKNYEHTLTEAIGAAAEIIDTASQNDGLIGITTGLSELDESIGGFHNSDLFVVGARPAMGKTALLFNFAHAANVPCGIISAEQNHAQAGLRFIAMEGEINSQRMRSAKLQQHEWAKLATTMNALKGKPVFINDEPGIDILSLTRQARVWKQNNGIKMLCVDYIQKIKGSSNRQSAMERVTEVTGTLKDLARELEIPVIALSQVNRAADQLDYPPGPSHLSDASAVEKEADTIITMFSNDELKSHSQILLHICKNRHGPTGDVTVNYLGPFFKFQDAGPREAAA